MKGVPPSLNEFQDMNIKGRVLRIHACSTHEMIFKIISNFLFIIKNKLLCNQFNMDHFTRRQKLKKTINVLPTVVKIIFHFSFNLFNCIYFFRMKRYKSIKQFVYSPFYPNLVKVRK